MNTAVSTASTVQRRKSSKKNSRQILKGQLKSTRYKTTPQLNNQQTSYLQQDLFGSVISRDADANYWGDAIADEKDNCWRIRFQNIGPQRASSTHEHSCRTTDHIIKTGYQVFLFAEHGLHLSRIPFDQTWDARMKSASPLSFSILSNNTHEKKLVSSTSLTGGTGVSIFEDAVSRKVSAGRDLSGLGRWTWVMVRGKQEFKTTFISAYRPVYNPSDHGSVWRQHQRYLLQNNDVRDPLDAFMADLSVLLTSFLENNHQIIIGMDCNNNIR